MHRPVTDERLIRDGVDRERAMSEIPALLPYGTQYVRLSVGEDGGEVVDEALLALVPLELVVRERVPILSLGGLGHRLCHRAVVPSSSSVVGRSMKTRTSTGRFLRDHSPRPVLRRH